MLRLPRTCVVSSLLAAIKFQCPSLRDSAKTNMFSNYLEDGDSVYSICSCRSGVALRQLPLLAGRICIGRVEMNDGLRSEVAWFSCGSYRVYSAAM